MALRRPMRLLARNCNFCSFLKLLKLIHMQTTGANATDLLAMIRDKDVFSSPHAIWHWISLASNLT